MTGPTVKVTDSLVRNIFMNVLLKHDREIDCHQLSTQKYSVRNVQS